MNKKLVASLLTLGLVFSPVTGAITETYVTEVSADEADAKTEELKDTIRYVSDEYEKYKNDNYYRLGDDKLKVELETVIKEAIDYVDTGRVSLENLEKHLIRIIEVMDKLAENAKENQKNLKINIIASRSLLANNTDKSENEEYKVLSEKIVHAIDILKIDNLGKTSFEDLWKANNELVESFNKAKEKLEDEKNYSEVKDEDYNELNTELEKSQKKDENFENLQKERQSLIESDEAFKITEAYVNATPEKKQAYDNALKGLKEISDLEDNEENQNKLSEKINILKQARQNIDDKDEVTVDSQIDYEKKLAIDKEIKTLRDYVLDMSNINKIIVGENFKNQELADLYNKEIKKAMDLSWVPDYTKDLKEYQDAAAKLKDLTDKIKTEDQKPGPITPTEPTEKQFKTQEEARDAINKLLDATKGITIEDFYGSDQKEARDAYNKAREDASNLTEKKDSSLEDLNKAYNSFNKSLRDLNDFLRKRLEKLADEEKTYIESENFKKASEENQKTYKDLIAKAKEELKKDPADANVLNKLYKDINSAKEVIDGKLSDQARKLKAAIEESKAFMESDHYKSFGSGLTGAPQKAKKNYENLIKKAKELEKADKLDSDEAKTTLELIENAKAFIEGKISEKKYLSKEYSHILKELTKQKGYTEKVNQAARDRIDEALRMYDKGAKDEDTILSALEEAINESSVQEFIKEINNPNKNRDEILSKLSTLVAKDKEFREGDKYKKAPKELRADYDKAFEEAQKIIGMESPTEAEAKEAYDKLIAAVNKIEQRDIIDRRLVVLANKFKENQLKIANPNDRKAIADKINALKNNPYTTIEEVEKVENELDNLIKQGQVVTTTTVTPTTQAPTTQVPTTTRPVSTITNPGSIVKTGIKGIAKVAAVLAVAAIILIITRKKGDKNETNK